MLKSVMIIFLLFSGLSACVSTSPQYRVLKDGQEAEIKATDVNYRILPSFYSDPPDCVMVLTSASSENRQMNVSLATALARHMGEKVDHVIFPRKIRHLAKKTGLDLHNKQDRQRLAHRSKCHFYAIAELYDLGDDYVGVFAKKHIGVRVELKKIADDVPLWQAAHTVWRGDGGLPLSPIGAIGGVASAAMFARDDEIMPSLIDDAMRRMVRTLPYSLIEAGT